jgi:hypothetical protein
LAAAVKQGGGCCFFTVSLRNAMQLDSPLGTVDREEACGRGRLPAARLAPGFPVVPRACCGTTDQLMVSV